MRKRLFNSRFIFDHMPKVAGQSIITWLKNNNAGIDVASFNGFHEDLIRLYGGSSLIAGHIDFSGDGNAKLDPRYEYITCLREPIERCLSWLFFVKNNFHHDNSNDMEDTKLRVNRFLDSEGDDFDLGIAYAIENLYVKHFSIIQCEMDDAHEEPAPIIEKFSPMLKAEIALAALLKQDISSYTDVQESDINQWKEQLQRYIAENVFGEPKADDFSDVEHSLKIIKQYSLVGLYEDLPEFCKRFSQLIGNNHPVNHIPVVNQTLNKPSNQEVSEKLKNALVRLNQKDIVFYNNVKEWLSETAN